MRRDGSERLWLHARIFLIALGNFSGWPGESNGSDVRFLFLSLMPIPPPKREFNAVSAIADEIWQYRTGGKPHDI